MKIVYIVIGLILFAGAYIYVGTKDYQTARLEKAGQVCQNVDVSQYQQCVQIEISK